MPSRAEPGSLLLAWLCANGEGPIDMLNSTLLWWADAQGFRRAARPWLWLREMSALGYLELDWDSGRWAVSPTCLTELPAGDGLILATGALSPQLEHALSDLPDAYLDRAERGDAGGYPLPPALLLLPEIESTAASLAAQMKSASLDVKATRCAARAIANRLPNVAAPLEPAAGPSNDIDVESFNTAMVGDPLGQEAAWLQVPFAALAAGPGLYRWRSPRLVHRLRTNDGWWAVDRDDGVYRAMGMAGLAEDELRFAFSTGSASEGTLMVPKHAPLPPLQRRAATLCSGLPADTGVSVEKYGHVPLDVAERIATSLGQRLHQINANGAGHG